MRLGEKFEAAAILKIYQNETEKYQKSLTEALAASDDELAKQYLSGKVIFPDAIRGMQSRFSFRIVSLIVPPDQISFVSAVRMPDSKSLKKLLMAAPIRRR